MRSVTLLLVVPMMLGVQSEKANAETWRMDHCRYRSLFPPARVYSEREIRRTISCAVEHFPVSGGVSKALSVAECESGLYPKARNSYSSAAGIFQFLSSTWAGTYSRFRKLTRRWALHDQPMNPRANVVLGVRKAHDDGWSAWVCQ